MNINVDVTDISLDSQVGTHRVYDGEGGYDSAPLTLGEAVADRIAERLTKDDRYPTLRDEVLQLRKEEVLRRLEPIVTEAINRPVQRTNTFGDVVGGPTSLTDLIVKEARDYLSKSDGYSNRETVLQKTVREAVDKAIKKELAAVVAEEKEKVVAAVRAKAAELIAEAVKQGVGR